MGQPKHRSLIHPPIMTADTVGADWPSPRVEDGRGQQAMQSNPSPTKLLTLCLCLSVCLCLSPSHPSLSLSVSVSLSLSISLPPSHPSLYLSVCLSVCLSLSLSPLKRSQLQYKATPPIIGTTCLHADLTRKLSINILSRKKADERAKSCGFADGYFVDAVWPGPSPPPSLCRRPLKKECPVSVSTTLRLDSSQSHLRISGVSRDQ